MMILRSMKPVLSILFVCFLLPTPSFADFDFARDISSTAYGVYGVRGDAPLVPIPGAVWLFGSGLLGLIGFINRKRAALMITRSAV